MENMINYIYKKGQKQLYKDLLPTIDMNNESLKDTINTIHTEYGLDNSLYNTNTNTNIQNDSKLKPVLHLLKNCQHNQNQNSV